MAKTGRAKFFGDKWGERCYTWRQSVLGVCNAVKPVSTISLRGNGGSGPESLDAPRSRRVDS